MRRRHLLALPGLLPPTLLLPAAARGQARPRVVASFSILGDMVRQLAGELVELRVIAGANADAHGFQPRPSDAEALRGAALVVRNGLGFDGWMDRMLRAAGHRGPVATATEGIVPRQMPAHAHGHAHGQPGGQTGGQTGGQGRRMVPDPHAWQDLRHGIRYVRTIATALAAALPGQAATIGAAAERSVSRLGELDLWVRAQVATVPAARRRVVTSHDAFGYFGEAYGITFLAPQGVSTAAEPSAQAVAALIRQVRAEGITAVFLENMGNPATLERLAREAGVVVRGRLHADALSAADGPAPTYEAMFRHNVGLLVPAMRGDAA